MWSAVLHLAKIFAELQATLSGRGLWSVLEQKKYSEAIYIEMLALGGTSRDCP